MTRIVTFPIMGMVDISRNWVWGFGTFDGGDELAAVEDGLVNAAVAAFAQETVGGEGISGRDKIGVRKLSDFERLDTFFWVCFCDRKRMDRSRKWWQWRNLQNKLKRNPLFCIGN